MTVVRALERTQVLLLPGQSELSLLSGSPFPSVILPFPRTPGETVKYSQTYGFSIRKALYPLLDNSNLLVIFTTVSASPPDDYSNLYTILSYFSITST